MKARRVWSLAALVLGCTLPVMGDGSPAAGTGPSAAPASMVQTSPAPPLSDRDKHQADAETKEGADAAADIDKQMKLITDPAILKRVDTIGQRLAAVADTTTVPAEFGNDHAYPFTWHFSVVDSKEVNAFSLPGGHVYVNSGLLDAVRSDDELAGVLGHEITHAAHHHIDTISHIQNTKFALLNVASLLAVIASMMGRGNGGLMGAASAGQYAEMGILNNTYSEQAERDADHGGTILMQKAGFNPVGMLTFMERLGDFEDRSPQVNQGIFQNHPPAAERVELLRAELAQMHVSVTARALRLVSGGFRASVRAGTVGQTEDIVFNKEVVATLADPSGARARATADLLNTLLDNGLQMYQVDVDNATLLAADRPLLAFSPADAALTPGATPASLAAQARKNLQKGLWAQSFVVSEPTL